VDIHLATSSGRQTAIDVQVLRYSFMRPRIHYYNSKMLTGQMKSGFDYDAIRQSINVVITNHTLLPEEDGYLNVYEMRNRKSQGIGVYFFNVNIPRKTAYFEEKIHRKVEKVE
jgi:hypothetical protein